MFDGFIFHLLPKNIQAKIWETAIRIRTKAMAIRGETSDDPALAFLVKMKTLELNEKEKAFSEKWQELNRIE